MYKAIVILLLSNLIVGCAYIPSFEPKPWVKPYERDNLADPIMAFDRNGIDGKFMTHGFGNREAAIGAEGSGGGGCGCN
ncbi:MAG: DUF4266 domain-containing protein [Agarilytica sp.]